MEMSYKGTPASSQIIWLEQRVKELESQYDITLGAIRVGVERIEQLTSGPGGIMEMKQTIADKEQRIEKLETALEHTMECFLGAREALKECVIERDEARKALEGKEPLEWTENYGQGSEPWLNKE
jgi:uncharacterized coiled-coil protein SlyX